MNKEIPKNYIPSESEDGIYKLWEESGFFNPDNMDLPEDAKPYTIILPPPNITDKLHLGHASIIAIEDLLIRFHRMKGYRTLYLPGTDHAAIATQNVVEKKLLKEKGLTRHDLGKEKFLEEVWKFLRETQATILNQARKMGGSFDWSREAFTLDETRKKAVTKMFIDMYNEGLVYRGKRIVNWCPRCQSTLADDEVEYQEENGKLYWLKYGPFILATSRPETKLGDTAVAVHPDDDRYKEFVGKKYKIHGVLGEFEVVVVADKSVDPSFGSGAVKVTPAHDFADYETAKRHDIPMKQIIDEKGCMMENCGKYFGMTTKEAREEIVSDMEKMGLIDHIDDNYVHNISVCYRCGATIEPIPSEQWFLAVDKKLARFGNKSLKEKALEVAEAGKIKFIPFRFTKRYSDWMKNLHDWCISRQIWFGHEFPVWYRDAEIYVGEKAPEGDGWRRDPDTFDTWFSSGMWTFTTLGWPDNYKDGKKLGDLGKFHPTQVLETGYEIITLWVSRMIMMSLFALGEIPFENVYLHGMVLDKFGKKMSKSKGNGIDPLDMSSKFGTDAVRLSLLVGATPGNDLRVSEEKIESLRNFMSKLWNIYRYCNQSSENFDLIDKLESGDIKSLSDKWIIGRITEIISGVTEDLDKYRFSSAGEKLQKFVWDDFADWYIEINKIEKNEKVLGYVLDKILKLLHPFAPFITEKIFQDFQEGKKLLMVSAWPKADESLIDYDASGEFNNLKNIITRIRNIRSSYRIDASMMIDAYGTEISGKEIIEKLARIRISEAAQESGKFMRVSEGDIALDLDIAKLIDVEKEKARIQGEIKNLESSITRIENTLKNEKFLAGAPKEIVEESKARMEEYKTKLETQKELLVDLKEF